MKLVLATILAAAALAACGDKEIPFDRLEDARQIAK